MRIAISGTHAAGKTTLIEAFLETHPGYEHEPEPYEVLQELHGEEFPELPTADDYQRQLEAHLKTLQNYSAVDQVLFERSPADFLAYIFAVDGPKGHDAVVASVRGAMPRLDAVVFLPLDDQVKIAVAETEDLELRECVDEWLQDILLNDKLDLFAAGKPVLVEARGTVEQRLAVLEALLE